MSTPPPIIGMHPELETPKYFPSLHATLNVLISFALTPLLPDGYAVAVEQGLTFAEDADDATRYVPDIRVDEARRGGTAVLEAPTTLTADTPTFVVGAPSQPQRYLAVRYFGDAPSTRGTLVTTIELLSPANKTGEGYVAFEDKQADLAARGVHLVEIDLLRRGRRRWPDQRVDRADYIATVLRDGDEVASVWCVNIQQTLPKVPVPLRAPDADVVVDLEAVMQEFLIKSGVRRRIAILS